MLLSQPRTNEEKQEYLTELKAWMAQEKDVPLEKMTDFFAKHVNGYDGIHLEGWPQEYKYISDYFDQSSTKILDIGCGTGLELAAIFEKIPDAEITGVDLSEEMLLELKRKYADKNIELQLGDYFELPFKQNFYDAALSFQTLHHFKLDKKRKIYEKIFQALHSGGYYVECDYIACNEEEEKLCLAMQDYKLARSQLSDDEFTHVDIPLTWEHQRGLLEAAGFHNVQVLYENGSTMIIRAEKE